MTPGFEPLPDVSFVVPTRNSERTLAACLNSLARQEGAAVEVIVVDNESNDATREIADAYDVIFLIAGPERSAQRNAGLRRSTADVVVFIDSDMVCELGVARELKGAFGRRHACAVIPERSFGRGYLAAARALDRAAHEGNPSVEAARAFSRLGLLELGGFREDLSAGEDWELDDRIGQCNWLKFRLSSYIWHDEGRIRLHLLFRKKRYYSFFLRRYLATAPSRKKNLTGRYLSTRALGTLARSPWLWPGLVALKATEFLAFASGVGANPQSSR